MLLDRGDAVDRLREVVPRRSLPHKHSAAAGRQTVIAPPALSGLLNPSSFDPAAFFEAIERGIERGDVKRDGAVGLFFDLFADVDRTSADDLARAREIDVLRALRDEARGALAERGRPQERLRMAQRASDRVAARAAPRKGSPGRYPRNPTLCC